MGNKRINKAYVRYDGTGRVIAGGNILSRLKPKDGNWSEIPAYECCNPTTTTSTTTSGSTTTTSTTTSGPVARAYSYVISGTDLAAATGNTDTNVNGKIYAITADDGSGNPASRTFSASGSYIHWLCSMPPIVPTFGYYASNVFVTVGLVSTQTDIGVC
jgi:hypothetical protein